MSKLIDLTGQKFGRWTVLKRAENKILPSKQVKSMWVCKCVCGNVKDVSGDQLRRGVSTSCGCYNREVNSQRMSTHKESSTRLYKTYQSMKDRCYNHKQDNYERYGGRGITVCDEWKNSYESFRDWALSHGYESHLTIDRIDSNKSYNPQNCKWSTIIEQANNKRNSKLLNYRGEVKTLAQWCSLLNLPYNAIQARIDKKGWSAEQAFETPIRLNSKPVYYKGEHKTLTEWCSVLHLGYNTISGRIKRGWSVEKALETPIKSRKIN